MAFEVTGFETPESKPVRITYDQCRNRHFRTDRLQYSMNSRGTMDFSQNITKDFYINRAAR